MSSRWPAAPGKYHESIDYESLRLVLVLDGTRGGRRQALADETFSSLARF